MHLKNLGARTIKMNKTTLVKIAREELDLIFKEQERIVQLICPRTKGDLSLLEIFDSDKLFLCGKLLDFEPTIKSLINLTNDPEDTTDIRKQVSNMNEAINTLPEKNQEKLLFQKQQRMARNLYLQYWVYKFSKQSSRRLLRINPKSFKWKIAEIVDKQEKTIKAGTRQEFEGKKQARTKQSSFLKEA
eukprot:TRINITY_DN2332_c0_g1_i1.p2 TRINITY_DN2332_c0_g1~~TRINITY_DN2332_c0_g1_i1.p2  ORF type:complete len:188 (-),score=5.80 TRINITY_DN2332_c0_g1_i1:357-920(-)